MSTRVNENKNCKSIYIRLINGLLVRLYYLQHNTMLKRDDDNSTRETNVL
jgi:hypothetical protein